MSFAVTDDETFSMNETGMSLSYKSENRIKMIFPCEIGMPINALTVIYVYTVACMTRPVNARRSPGDAASVRR
jgi:hypothetical protein